jgi:hypothetical protein
MRKEMAVILLIDDFVTEWHFSKLHRLYSRDWLKKTSIQIAGLRAGTRTRNLPTTKQKR